MQASRQRRAGDLSVTTGKPKPPLHKDRVGFCSHRKAFASGSQAFESCARLTMMLDSQNLERYPRHIVLREVGGPGQAKLKAARFLVVGAGGLGAPALLYLAAAGVGTLGVIDDDAVALSNLQRQVIHGTPEIGEPKVESAATAIRRLNPHVTVETHAARLAAANALALIAGYD